MTRPLLSVCLPTYNRASLLYVALKALAPQINALGDLVELVVCDNCSPDETPEVVKTAQEWCPIRYYRNKENIGANNNLLKLAYELAEGEFVWIVGDDDIVRPDGLKRIIDVLQAYPEIDYVFVNIAYIDSKLRPEFYQHILGTQDLPVVPSLSKKLTSCYLRKWEYVLDPEIDFSAGAFLMTGVIRVSVWKKYKPPKAGEDSSNLFSTYSFAVINAKTMVGRKAYYLGYPVIVTYYGHQETFKHLSLHVVVYTQELLELYIQNGVDRQRIENFREYMLREFYIEEHLTKLLKRPDLPENKKFSLDQFKLRNTQHRDLVNMILRSVAGNIIWDELNENPTQDLSNLITYLKDEEYQDKLFSQFLDRWQQEYDEGLRDLSYKHIKQLQSVLAQIKFPECVENAKTIVNFAPGNGGLLADLLKEYPNKSYYLIDPGYRNLTKLRVNYASADHVRCEQYQQRKLQIDSIDFAFSFLLSQRMPRTLWIDHLKEVHRILSENGSVIFQFAKATHPSSSDSVQNIASLGCSYSVEQIKKMAMVAGFRDIVFSKPYISAWMPENYCWYFCRLTKHEE